MQPAAQPATTIAASPSGAWAAVTHALPAVAEQHGARGPELTHPAPARAAAAVPSHGAWMPLGAVAQVLGCARQGRSQAAPRCITAKLRRLLHVCTPSQARHVQWWCQQHLDLAVKEDQAELLCRLRAALWHERAQVSGSQQHVDRRPAT